MKRQMFFLMAVFLISACGNRGGGAGGVSLRVRYGQSSDSSGTYGVVASYRVTISSNDMTVLILREFPADTDSARFDGFSEGASLHVLVEAVNADGLTIRRGRAGPVVIRAGSDVPADVLVNNVPVFTNVKDGATVLSTRFVPRVFAPGIAFEIEDHFGDNRETLPDAVSGEVSFSLADGTTESVLAVRIPALAAGVHVLTVRDPVTGESSCVEIRIVNRPGMPVLTTTAGGYAGPFSSDGRAAAFNLAEYFRLVAAE